MLETVSQFDIELSDFVYAQRYADRNATVERTGPRGGTTESSNTYKMRDAFQSELTLEFSISEVDNRRKSLLVTEESKKPEAITNLPGYRPSIEIPQEFKILEDNQSRTQ